MKNLILTVGLPRSGKSTWAKNYASAAGSLNVAIVNPDFIRLAMYGQGFIREMGPMAWFVTRIMINALFKAGHDNIILDATSITIESRNKWLGPDWTTFYKVFDTSEDKCINRAETHGRYDLIPVIEDMAGRYEPLTEVEEHHRFVSNL